MSEWNEEALIHYLKQRFVHSSGDVGIGDDCAVISIDQKNALLMTTDAMVEGIHFLKDRIPPNDLGHKLVAVNVSDIASMGGQPEKALLSIALPSTCGAEWTQQVLDGIIKACRQWNVQLIGGDTVGSKQGVFLNLTLIGSAKKDHIKYRHTARNGDRICVTRQLGDSAGGFKAMTQNIEVKQSLINAHFHPQPRVDQGIWFSKNPHVHAMMDLSDGLNCDLMRLCKAAKCGAKIELTNIPKSQHLEDAAKQHNWDAMRLAISGGEDYCLLVTIDPTQIKDIQAAFHNTFQAPLYDIGQIDHGAHVDYFHQGTKCQLRLHDYQHHI